jgi:hypothetical protein
MRRLFLALVTVAFVLPAFSASAFAEDVVDHEPFDALLKTYVNKKGEVAYGKLKANEKDLAKLDAYIESLAKSVFEGKRRAKLAAYINAYNANVIRKVIDNYPTKSVMKLDNFFKRDDIVVGGKKMSLDHLENAIIRPTFKEPRIHFVLVCAAKSCPKLQRKALTSKNVYSVMERATKAFIPAATTVDGKTVKTSKLFEWFAGDFKEKSGSVAAYLATYLPDHAELLKSGEAKIETTHYDWALNNQ